MTDIKTLILTTLFALLASPAVAFFSFLVWPSSFPVLP